MTKEEIHLVWVIGLVIITIVLCTTIIWINYNSWTLRFEMDDNTREAIESIKWSEINEKESQDISIFNYTSQNCFPVTCECVEWGCVSYCYRCKNEVTIDK